MEKIESNPHVSNVDAKIFQLPPELLKRIFSYLTKQESRAKAERVCKIFAHLVKTESYSSVKKAYIIVSHASHALAYSTLDFDKIMKLGPSTSSQVETTSDFDNGVYFHMNGIKLMYANLIENAIEGFFNRATELHDLKLDAHLCRFCKNYAEAKIHIILEPIISEIIRHSSAPIKNLEIGGYFSSSPSLPKLTQHFAQTLTRINCDDDYNVENHFTLSSIWYAVENAHNLINLFIWHFTDSMLIHSLRNKPLKQLKLLYVPRKFSTLPQPEASALARALHGLSNGIENLAINDACYPFSDFLNTACNHLTKLTNFTFSPQSSYCDGTFSQAYRLLDFCPDLKFISLKTPLEDDTAKFIATFLHKYENYVSSESNTTEATSRTFEIYGSNYLCAQFTSHVLPRYHHPAFLEGLRHSFCEDVQNCLNNFTTSHAFHAWHFLDTKTNDRVVAVVQMRFEFELGNAKLIYKTNPINLVL